MDAVHRFLLEDLDIRGALVQLGPSWAAMTRSASTRRRCANCWAKWPPSPR
jgi:redox-regulated HSP33 family molecular chaperone